VKKGVMTASDRLQIARESYLAARRVIGAGVRTGTGEAVA
jgi:hypothetical protein